MQHSSSKLEWKVLVSWSLIWISGWSLFMRRNPRTIQFLSQEYYECSFRHFFIFNCWLNTGFSRSTWQTSILKSFKHKNFKLTCSFVNRQAQRLLNMKFSIFPLLKQFISSYLSQPQAPTSSHFLLIFYVSQSLKYLNLNHRGVKEEKIEL